VLNGKLEKVERAHWTFREREKEKEKKGNEEWTTGREY
jgi:hypothetical protein